MVVSVQEVLDRAACRTDCSAFGQRERRRELRDVGVRHDVYRHAIVGDCWVRNDDLRRKRTGYDVAFRVESLVLDA